jgi:hypothetical protein
MIKLTTPFVVEIGGALVENDVDGACTSIVTDFQARIQTVTFQVGTIQGTPPALNPGAQAQLNNQTYILTTHMDTGVWSDNHGHSGTLPPSYLNPIQQQSIADRNDAEQPMSVQGGLMPGVFTPWTSV